MIVPATEVGFGCKLVFNGVFNFFHRIRAFFVEQHVGNVA